MVRAEKQAAAKLNRPPKPVTVKCSWGGIRIGLIFWSSHREWKRRELPLWPCMPGPGSRCTAKADWSAIAEVKNVLSIPVIGSGDVFTAEDANRMLRETGCDFVMIARGALGNPWIFRDVLCLYEGKPLLPLSPDEKRAVILRHIEMQVAQSGERRAVLEMRKHVGWYLKGTPGAAELRRKANNSVKVEDLISVLGP